MCTAFLKLGYLKRCIERNLGKSEKKMKLRVVTCKLCGKMQNRGKMWNFKVLFAKLMGKIENWVYFQNLYKIQKKM